MAMTLSTVKAKVAVVTVTWTDETVDVGYLPAAITPALLEEVTEAGKADNMDVIGTMLEPVLAWWDVLDDDGKRLPTDAATIRLMPVDFLNKVMEATQESMRPPTPGR